MSKAGAKGGKRAATRAVGAGRDPHAHHGSVNPPVYHASTLLHPTLEALEKKTLAYSYGRRGSPTIHALEAAMNELQGGDTTVIVPSGLAACTLAIMAVAGAGDHLLMVDTTYGPTRTFCDTTLKRFGVETTYYDPLIGGAIGDLIRPNTRAIFAESPGSLTFEVQDIPAIAMAARAKGVALILDNTWATPLLFDAVGHGADLVVHAATKYIVGHSDALLGTVTATPAYAKRLRDTHGNLGLTAAPDDINLGQRGLRTLAVRLKQHQETAMALSLWLQRRPEVEHVLYPALSTDPGYSIWKRDFTGASGLFGVALNPCSPKALAALFDHLELFGMGWSWGGYESLIVPAHVTRTATKRKDAGPLIRIHAGLEAVEDLINDLEAGFERMKEAA